MQKELKKAGVPAEAVTVMSGAWLPLGFYCCFFPKSVLATAHARKPSMMMMLYSGQNTSAGKIVEFFTPFLMQTSKICLTCVVQQ